ncbi:MAG: HAMP domain-containing protein [Desulfobacteraceae bacterium]|nr:HAMP domain-containing protein [Desulfobacteraceae bacterium]
MKVICEHCSENYRIDEDVINQIKIRAKCRSCGNHFSVDSSHLLASPTTAGVDDFAATMSGDQGFDEAPMAVPASSSPTDSGVSIKWTNSIQARMSAILVLVTIIIFAGFVYYNYVSTKKEMQNDLTTFADVASTRLSKGLVESVWALDEKQMEDTLDSEMLDQRISAIYIKDRDGQSILSGKKRDRNEKPISSKTTATGDFIEKQSQLTKDDQKIGHVEVYLTPKYMQRALKKSIINMVVTAAVLIFAILLAAIISLKKMIAEPIQKLTAAADQMSMGDLGVLIDVQTKSEIGSLAEALRRTQSSLSLALERLRRRG